MRLSAAIVAVLLLSLPAVLAQQQVPPVAPPTPMAPQTPIKTTQPTVGWLDVLNDTHIVHNLWFGFWSLVSNGISFLVSSGFNLGSLAGLCSGLVGGVGGGLGAAISLAVSGLNAIGSAFVVLLQGVGFTIEGIIGLSAIGSIISIILSIIIFFISIIGDIINFAYTTGVGGVAIVGMLLSIVNILAVIISYVS